MVRKFSFASPKEFYEQFKDNPETAKKRAFQRGVGMGQELRQKYSIQSEDLEAVAEILNAAMKVVKGVPSAKVEDDKVTMKNTGLCIIMRTSLTLNIPWEWLETNVAWPWLEGIVSTIKPNMKLRMTSARCRGDSTCIHVFE